MACADGLASSMSAARHLEMEFLDAIEPKAPHPQAAGGCLTLTTALFHSPQDRIQHRQLGRRLVRPGTQVAAARRRPSRTGSDGGGSAAARGAGRLGADDPAALASGGWDADHVGRLHCHAPAGQLHPRQAHQHTPPPRKLPFILLAAVVG